jgi:multimeric flavodoxin WrbA
MRTVIVYESMYGNTHLIADAIARGLEPGSEVTVVPVARATRDLLDGADLVAVGGPTHVRGMSRASTRKAAVEQASKPGSELRLDTGTGAVAGGPGLREWLDSLGQISAGAAAFDTRMAGPALVMGRASKGIAKLLAHHGLTLIAPAESFLVTKDSLLRPGEEDRAQQWGKELAAKAMSRATGAGHR